jgi:hypothetical protein
MSLEILGEKPHRAVLFGGSVIGLEIDNQLLKVIHGGSTLQGGSIVIMEKNGSYYLVDLFCDKIVAGPFTSVDLATRELRKRVEKQQKYDLSPIADCETPVDRGLNLQLTTAEIRGNLAKEQLMKEAVEAALSDTTTDRFLTTEAGGVQLRPSSSYGSGFTRATSQINIAMEDRKQAIKNALQNQYSMDQFFSTEASEAAVQTIRVNPGTNTITTTTTTTTTQPLSMETFGLNNNLEDENDMEQEED